MVTDQALSVRARSALTRDPHWAAPVHQPLEFLNTIRGLVLGRRISETVASAALERFRASKVDRFDVLGEFDLVDRIWQLRHNVTPYDAAYVALAESLDATMLTADAKLATASGPRCAFQLIR